MAAACGAYHNRICLVDETRTMGHRCVVCAYLAAMEQIRCQEHEIDILTCENRGMRKAVQDADETTKKLHEAEKERDEWKAKYAAALEVFRSTR